MSTSSKNELSSIIWELQSIINGLSDVAEVLNNYSANIGSDLCASSLTSVTDKYTSTKRKLNYVDTSSSTQ